jgi:nucleoid-associated protein YgaU
VRRRRVLLGTVAAGLLAVLALPWSGTGGKTLATPGSALAGDSIAHHVRYVVQPGDTLWSIATRLDPTGDPRPVVALLAARLGSDAVKPGERVVLP